MGMQTQEIKDHISKECSSLAALFGSQNATPPPQQGSDSLSTENEAEAETHAIEDCAVRPPQKCARRANPLISFAPQGQVEAQAPACKNELPSAELPSEDDALKLLRHHEKRSRKYSEFLVRQAKGETDILRALALEKYLAGPRDVWVSDHISLHGQNKILEIVRDVLPIMRQRGDKDPIESGLTVVNHSLCDRMSQYRTGLGENMDCVIWKTEYEYDPWAVVPNSSSLAQMVELREAEKKEKDNNEKEKKEKMDQKRREKMEEETRETTEQPTTQVAEGPWVTDPYDGKFKPMSEALQQYSSRHSP